MGDGPQQGPRSTRAAAGDVAAAARDALGSDVLRVRRLRWGFAHQAFEVVLLDGRIVVCKRYTRAGRSERAIALLGPIAERLKVAGVPTPAVLATVRSAETMVVVFESVRGRAAAEWLDTPARAARVGRILGELAAGLRSVPTGGLDLDTTWSDPPRLASAAGSWARSARPLLPPHVATTVDRALKTLTARSPAPGVFVHGDYAPVNVLLHGPHVAGVLDLDHARIGPPELDAAWWSWVVRHHHPGTWDVAWSAFVEADPLLRGGRIEPAQIRMLQVVMLMERVATAAPGAGDRGAWVARLVEAAERR